ncbi:MAG TPA: bifunctional UDP-sugar hydrolase/5'-nucleotidase [Candidatus Acidoferrales bacterium]|nr:bifunctional UDP-sugar hydrolase/5'-nucleotidase [Candidatus Acidoferrales bacterium]
MAAGSAAAAAMCALALSAGIRVRTLRAAGSPQTVTLTLLSTTDLHGHVEPFDDITNRPANLGLAKIATLVRGVRAERPNVILLDCGDAIEGTPLAYYFAAKDTSAGNPVVAAMNALGYTAMSVGNHEFNFGLNALWRAKHQAHFPWLAANLGQQAAAGIGYFPPYIIRTVAGIRIAIVGFVTPTVPRWEIPAHYRGYQFEPITDAARRVIPQVRRQADLVVALVHSGIDRDPGTGREFNAIYPEENVAWELADENPGIDVEFYGHTHQEMPELFVHGVLLAQARNWGQSLAEADVTMEREAGAGWRVASKHSRTIPVTEAVAADPAIEKLDAGANAAVERYLDTPLANSPEALSGATGRIDDNALVDLIHAAQMIEGIADVSLATMFIPSAEFPSGQVTIRQMFALYPYENWLYTVQMTGAQLQAALEHAASFLPAWPTPPDRLRLPSYNADSAEGVNYRMDLTRPVGERIVDLTFRGQPLRPDQKLRVAINNYRYTGGGGYAMLAGLPVVYRSPDEDRDMIIRYLRAGHAIPAAPDGNWQVVPPEARRALISAAERAKNQFSGARLPARPSLGRQRGSRAARRRFPSVPPQRNDLRKSIDSGWPSC